MVAVPPRIFMNPVSLSSVVSILTVPSQSVSGIPAKSKKPEFEIESVPALLNPAINAFPQNWFPSGRP